MARSDGATTPTEDVRTTSEVLASLVVNVQALLAKQLELLSLEVREIVGRKVAAVVMLLVAVLAGGLVVMLGAVTAAVALEDVLDARWQAWGLVALAVLVPALVLIAVAARLLRTPATPERTRRELDATTAWLRTMTGVDGDEGETARGDGDASVRRGGAA
jgi:uncharacterized membrane protein YqjE